MLEYSERKRLGVPLTIAALFALLVHLPVRLDGLYGEQDVARLVNSGLLWLRAGLRTEALSQYQYYTSPAYIWLITLLLPGTLGEPAPAAAELNAINLIVAVLIPIPAYLLFRRIAGDRAALPGVLFLTVTPAFWLGGLYGFPTLPAGLFVVLALWHYDRWLVEGESRATRPLLVACTLCLCGAILLKADVYLSTVALPGLLVYRRRLSWRNLGLLGLIGVIPVLVLYGAARGLLQESPGALVYADTWRRTFPAAPGVARAMGHALQVVKSFGLLTLPLLALGLVLLVRRREYALAALLLAWTVVPVAFWAGRYGDSARHHFQSTIPAALGVGILLARLRISTGGRYALLAVIASVNYWAFAPSSSTVVTSGNLIRSGRLIARRVEAYQRLARSYADVTAPRTAFLGSFTNPFVENRVLSLADSILRVERVARFGAPATRIDYLRERRHRVSVLVALPSPLPPTREIRRIASAYASAGFAVYSIQLGADMRPLREKIRDLRLSELRLP